MKLDEMVGLIVSTITNDICKAGGQIAAAIGHATTSTEQRDANGDLVNVTDALLEISRGLNKIGHALYTLAEVHHSDQTRLTDNGREVEP